MSSNDQHSPLSLALQLALALCCKHVTFVQREAIKAVELGISTNQSQQYVYVGEHLCRSKKYPVTSDDRFWLATRTIDQPGYIEQVYVTEQGPYTKLTNPVLLYWSTRWLKKENNLIFPWTIQCFHGHDDIRDSLENVPVTKICLGKKKENRKQLTNRKPSNFFFFFFIRQRRIPRQNLRSWDKLYTSTCQVFPHAPLPPK